MKTVRDASDYADVFTKQAGVVAFDAGNPILDLIPIEGTRYAVPVERIEAAARVVNESVMQQLADRLTAEDVVTAVLTAALGEVLPVEAVGECYGDGTSTDGTVYLYTMGEEEMRELEISGRTVALISDAGKEAVR